MSILSDSRKSIENISTYVFFTNYRFLYLYTTEESKTMQILEDVAEETETKKIYTYDIVRGLQCEKDKKLKYRKKEEKADIYRTLEFITDNIEGKSFVIFKDIHSLFETDPRLVRAFKNCINDILINQIPVYLFVISPVLHIPPEIEKEAVVIDIPLPSRDEIKKILNEFLGKNNFYGVSEILKSN